MAQMPMGSMYIKVTQPVLRTNLQRKLMELIEDKDVTTDAHWILGEVCNEFVPRKTGELRKSMVATKQFVRWETPYAKYQYEGEVWGPNYVGYTDSSLNWEWRGAKQKHPMGRELGANPGTRLLRPKFGRNFSTNPIEVVFGYSEPNTKHHWFDEAMENGGLRKYSLRVTEMLKRKAKVRRFK